MIKVRTGGRGWNFYQKINSNRPHSVVFDNMGLKFKTNTIFQSSKEFPIIVFCIMTLWTLVTDVSDKSVSILWVRNLRLSGQLSFLLARKVTGFNSIQWGDNVCPLRPLPLPSTFLPFRYSLIIVPSTLFSLCY